MTAIEVGVPRRPKATPAQRIARAQAEIARQKSEERAADKTQKIICGALIIAGARENANARKFLIEQLKTVSRKGDIKRIAPLLAELEAIHSKAADVPARPSVQTSVQDLPVQQVMGPRPASQMPVRRHRDPG